MLRYNNIYGDANAYQNIKVYELNEVISPDSAYYTNHKIQYYNTLLADYSFKPDLTDSIKINGVKEPPHLRVKLNQQTNYFGNKIIYAPSNILAANTNFLEFVKERVPEWFAV